MERGADVVIVGGGPAGAAAAIALRRAGAEVLLLERSAYEAPRIGETVPPAIGPALGELGIELDPRGEHLRASGTAAAWGGPDLGYHDFLRSAEGPGLHLDRARFDAGLAEAARAAGAGLYTGTSLAGVEALDRGGFHLSLRLSRSRGPLSRVEARLVIDATGRRAAVATALGASRIHHDDLVCVAAVMELGGRPPGEGFAVIEAERDLWWYSAALPGHRAIVACMSDADLVRTGRLFDEAVWRERLRATTHVAPRVAAAISCSRPRLFCARTQTLSRLHGDGWLAVGDAAAAYDPLSSAGIVKALRSGLSAARAARSYRGGDAGALGAFAEGVERELDGYFAGLRRCYAAEARFADAPFWRRRRGVITLSPRAFLSLPPAAEARRALVRSRDRLPPEDLRRIADLCAQPRSAASLIEILRREGRGRSDRATIEAIDHLVGRGLLTAAGPA